MKSQDIVSNILAGNTTKAFELIYKYFPAIRKMIIVSGGNGDDAKDVFQDGVIVFYRMCQKKDFQLTSSIETLIYAICKNLWYKKIRDHHSKFQTVSQDQMNEGFEEEVSDDELMNECESIGMAEKVLKDLGSPCSDILIKFYYEKSSMKEIADNMGYSNEKTVKAQKYKCLERGKKILKEKLVALKSLIS